MTRLVMIFLLFSMLSQFPDLLNKKASSADFPVYLQLDCGRNPKRPFYSFLTGINASVLSLAFLTHVSKNT